MKKHLKNLSERQIGAEISNTLLRYDANLFEKIRIADVIDIEKLNIRSLGTYALQAHFDFLISDARDFPLFAIEFDGFGHNTKNDKKKNSICQQADLGLFRLFSSSSRVRLDEMTFVRYLVDLWFHAREFRRWQEQGTIAIDEPFSMSAFLKPDAKNIFDSEYNFIGRANGLINSAVKSAGLSDNPFPHLDRQHVRISGPDGDLVAYEAVNICGIEVVGKYRIRISVPCYGELAEVLFAPFEIGEFCSGLAVNDLIENIRLVGSGAGHVVPSIDEYVAEIETLLAQGYSFAGGGSGGRSSGVLLQIAFPRGSSC